MAPGRSSPSPRGGRLTSPFEAVTADLIACTLSRCTEGCIPNRERMSPNFLVRSIHLFSLETCIFVCVSCKSCIWSLHPVHTPTLSIQVFCILGWRLIACISIASLPCWITYSVDAVMTPLDIASRYSRLFMYVLLNKEAIAVVQLSVRCPVSHPGFML